MKTIKTLIVLLMFSSVVIAQEHHHGNERPNREKIKSMKIAFITEKLDLTPEEAQQFWPIYNEYEKKRGVILKEKRMGKKNKKENGTQFSDTEVEQRIEKHFISRQKELDLDKEYHTKFTSVLPIKKVGKLYITQDQFKRELLKRIKRHRDSGDREGHPKN